MSASAPAAAPKRAPAFIYANFTAESARDLDLMSEIWLLDVCGAPWVSREAQKLSAFIVMVLGGGRPGEIYLRDIESILNIMPEETNRGLKLLKVFRAIEDFHIDKGKLTLSVRVGHLQRLHMLEAREKLVALDEAEASALAEQAATRSVELLRGVAAMVAEPVAEEAPMTPPLAANG